MANLLRDWLRPFLEEQLEAALAWKSTQVKRSLNGVEKRIKSEYDEGSDVDNDDDGDISEDGSSNVRISVTRGKSDNSYVQLVGVRLKNATSEVINVLIHFLVQNL